MPGYRELFERYPNPVFIETGSYLGDGIQAAHEAGFETIYSIELSENLYNYCRAVYGYCPGVHLICGDSAIELANILKEIHEPVTFWLDSHYSGGATAMGAIESPLLQELEVISRHEIKTHTILIDDMRCWTMEIHGFNTQSLVERISRINTDYWFQYEDGRDNKLKTYKNDILVARCLQ